MRILKYKGKLVEEIGYASGVKVVFLKYIREEDKEKCPHCGKPVDTEISIVENCSNWAEVIRGVDTLQDSAKVPFDLIKTK